MNNNINTNTTVIAHDKTNKHCKHVPNFFSSCNFLFNFSLFFINSNITFSFSSHASSCSTPFPSLSWNLDSLHLNLDSSSLTHSKKLHWEFDYKNYETIIRWNEIKLDQSILNFNLLLTAQFLHLQNNLALFFTVVAFRSNNLSPHPHTFEDIFEDDAQLCDILEPLFLCEQWNPLLPLFITLQRSSNVNVIDNVSVAPLRSAKDPYQRLRLTTPI